MNYTYTNAYKDESRFFFLALAILGVAVSAYIYFVSDSIMSVVVRKEIEHEITELSSSLGNLEAAYIERQHMVSDSLAYERGYVAVTDKTFITRDVQVTVASIED